MVNKNEHPKISKLQERRTFLLRALHNKNVENINGAKLEIKDLESQIKTQVQEILKVKYDDLRNSVKTVKTTISSDGNMKREIASIIIKILDDVLEVEDLKGVFRQGYKIMRTRC